MSIMVLKASKVDSMWVLVAVSGDVCCICVIAGVGRGIVDKVYSDVGDEGGEGFE